MNVRELVTILSYKTDEASLRRVEKNITTVSKKMQSIGTKLTAFVTLPILGIGAAMLKVASDAGETDSKFKTVFKDVSESSQKVAVDLSKNYGLARDESKKLLSDTGDLLTGFGFTGNSALDLSEKVNKLAVDLASFTNFSGGASGASAALTKALLGERDSVKSLGISILEEDVKKEVAIMRAKGLTFETMRQAKAYATLNIAIRQSKNAIGDYARTNKDFANQVRKLKATIRNMFAEWGKFLIPIGNKVVGVLIKLSDIIMDSTPTVKIFVLSLMAITAVIPPLLVLLGSLGLAVSGLIPLFFTLDGEVMTFDAAVLTIPAIILAVIIALALFIDELVTWVNGGDSIIGQFLGSWENFRDGFLGIWEGIKNGLKTVFGIITNVFSGFIDIIKGMLGDDLVNSIKTAFGSIPIIIRDAFNSTMEFIDKAWGKFSNSGFVKFFGKVYGKGKSFVGDISQSAESFANGGGKMIGAELRSNALAMGTLSSQNINISSKIDIGIPFGVQESPDLVNNFRKVVREENERMINQVSRNNQEG